MWKTKFHTHTKQPRHWDHTKTTEPVGLAYFNMRDSMMPCGDTGQLLGNVTGAVWVGAGGCVPQECGCCVWRVAGHQPAPVPTGPDWSRRRTQDDRLPEVSPCLPRLTFQSCCLQTGCYFQSRSRLHPLHSHDLSNHIDSCYIPERLTASLQSESGDLSWDLPQVDMSEQKPVPLQVPYWCDKHLLYISFV
jgi:hypothetical protein